MVNYNKSMIYKLCCKDLNITDIYIGSTTNFKERKIKHRIICNNNNLKYVYNNNLKVYKFIREHGGWDNWDMVLIDNVSCESKLELRKIEREYIEKYNSTLNSIMPFKNEKEYREYHKKWYETNKNKINDEKRKEKINCECGSVVRKSDIARHKKSKKHINFVNNKIYN